MSDSLKTGKPQFRNINITDLVHYRMPLAAIISILHRVSGAVIFLLLPVILLLLDKSLMSEISFEHFRGIASHWFVKLIILALVWAYLHHFCAGIRHLFADVHVGADKVNGRKSAAIVLAISLPLTALVALKLFGAF